MFFKNKIVFFSALIIIIFLQGGFAEAEEASNKKIFYLNEKGVTSGLIFSKEDLLWPGKKVVKEFYIVNDNNFKCYLKNLSVGGKLEKQNGTQLNSSREEYRNFMNNVQVRFCTENKELFNGSAEEFLNINAINNNCFALNEKEKKKFYLEFYFKEGANNSTMNLNYIFNINANYFNENKSILSEVKTGAVIDNKMLLIIGLLLCIGGITSVLISRITINREEAK